VTRRRGSLIGALFGRVGLLFLAIVLAVGLLAFQTARKRIDQVYDGQLIVGANVLRALMADELQERAAGTASEELQVDDAPLISAEDRKAFDDYATWRMFRIWQAGHLVMRSDTGPFVAAPPPRDGFEDILEGRRKWRVYTLHVPGQPVAVQVGERMGIRAALVRSITLELAIPLLLLIPAAALLIWASLNDGLVKLRRLVAELGQRTSRDLSPLEVEAWPSDLSPLVSSINQLLQRMDRSFHRERSFVDQAAHQLRTPLAVVKLQAQMIERETSPGERQDLIRQLSGGVDRAALLIDRLLTLARLESEPESMGQGDLSLEAAAALADLAPLAEAQSVDLAFAGGPAQVRGDPALIRLICANLIENALRHSPPNAEIAVVVDQDAEGWLLKVTDAGQGIPAQARERVLERFYRGDNADTRGVGLGLSIVAEAVRLVGGRLELRGRADGRSGLEARVVFAASA
jgi:signal transduction histidine kinase